MFEHKWVSLICKTESSVNCFYFLLFMQFFKFFFFIFTSMWRLRERKFVFLRNKKENCLFLHYKWFSFCLVRFSLTQFHWISALIFLWGFEGEIFDRWTTIYREIWVLYTSCSSVRLAPFVDFLCFFLKLV